MVKGVFKKKLYKGFASVRKFEGLKKCHNCRNGKTDGGFKKRIKQKMESVRLEMDNSLKQIKSDDKDRATKTRAIEDEYDQKMNELKHEKPNKIGNCNYCFGIGDRKPVYAEELIKVVV